MLSQPACCLVLLGVLVRGGGGHTTGSRLAVVLSTTESATDWARLEHLLPLWSEPGREACTAAAPAGSALEPLPYFCGSQLAPAPGGGAQPPPATKPSLSPLLIAYTPRAPLGPDPRQRLLELLGGAEACFREVLFWGCNLSAAEDVYPMGANAMWCACAQSGRSLRCAHV